MLAAALSTVLPTVAGAQGANGRDVWLEHAVGDELERYLRSLEALGEIRASQWSVRPFSPVQLDRQRRARGEHPWRGRLEAADTTRTRWTIVRPRADVRYNSTFPSGGNDGAIWEGRGVTAAASGGVAGRWGALSVALAPVAFWTQNQAFPIRENGATGAAAFGDGQYPTLVDRPQRFGDGSYAQLDPGQSTVRVDAYGAAAGVSTANVWWGPAQEYPFLLGNNAAGFPHAFVGTSAPANVWVGRLHASMLWGRLEQSDYFVPTGPVQRRSRFATGLLVSFSPRGLENLEVGGARFFHAPWPDDGIPGRYLTRGFEGLLKSSLPELDGSIDTDSRSIDGENQIAAVFARLVLPGTGVEVYGEVGREDHPWDVRHLLLSHDEQSSLMLGGRKTWRGAHGRLRAVRAEAINYQQRQSDRRRLGPAIYLHSSGSNQGHTQRGQLLGANLGVGSSAGAFVAYDVYRPDGRTTLLWRRVLRAEAPTLGPDGGENARALDVVHTVGAERVLFRGGADLLTGVDVSYNFNRDFVRDRVNVAVRVAVTGLP